MQMDRAELEKHVLYQMGALQGIATAVGHRVTHMNPHGALGNLACADRDIAECLADAIYAFDRDVGLIVLQGTELDRAAARRGLRRFNVFLADRAYASNGQLVPRATPGSVISEKAEILERVRRLLEDGAIVTFEKETLHVDVHSILVHSDTPGAIALAHAVRATILESGGRVVPLSRLGR